MIKRTFDQFALFLGPARLRALFVLIAVTGLVSLMLNAVIDESNTIPALQTLLALIALIGSAVIVIGRLDVVERGRWLAISLPAFGALILALTVLPNFALPLLGGALGWIVAGLFFMRSRTPMEYQKAVKHLRKSEYADAVKILDEVIKNDPQDPQHYRFRAEVLRLWGKLDRARRDYQKMTELAPDSAVAFNGLAEVDLQAGRYDEALVAAQTAADLAPQEWVALYNLGMIEDRLARSSDVIAHLDAALELRVPDARHRLLIHLYRARAYARLGDADAAQAAVDQVKQHTGGLEEWSKILESEQAETLRAAIGADVDAAQALAKGERAVMSLVNA